MKIIREVIEKAVEELGVPNMDFAVEHPRDERMGDYSTNVAMVLSKQVGKNPREVAQEIVSCVTRNTNARMHEIVEKVEVAGAGFINFYLKKEYLLDQMGEATKLGYGSNETLKAQKTYVEFTDPNPFKEFHIGHLMSNTIGESLARIFVANGAVVKRANYQGDVGLHVAKSIWGIKSIYNLKFTIYKDIEKWIEEWGAKSLNERQKMMGEAYVYGATKYEEDDVVKVEIHELNKKIYEGNDASLMELYRKGREWSLEYFETIYQRLGTKFDEYFFESEAGPVGLKVVEEGLAKGVLELGEEGAVVYKGEKDGLHTRVFRNKLGLATYEGKELGLAKTKFERYSYDLSYIVTANEITEYFKVLLAVMRQLYPELATKTIHVPHGMMRLLTGKMSSRTGKVVTGEGLLNDLKGVVLAKMGDRDIKDREKVADLVAVGALKFSVLRQQTGGDIVYEPEKMTNLEGATGPFVQYTFARAKSILRKFGGAKTMNGSLLQSSEPCSEEMSLLRWIYRYPEVVEVAARELAPHLVATYIYELASRFNTFYQACRVEEDGKVNELRYLLTQAVANVIKNGLGLLGIKSPEEM